MRIKTTWSSWFDLDAHFMRFKFVFKIITVQRHRHPNAGPSRQVHRIHLIRLFASGLRMEPRLHEYIWPSWNTCVYPSLASYCQIKFQTIWNKSAQHIDCTSNNFWTTQLFMSAAISGYGLKGFWLDTPFIYSQGFTLTKSSNWEITNKRSPINGKMVTFKDSRWQKFSKNECRWR